MTRLALAAAFLGGISATGAGQVVAPRTPVIDMHVHSTSGSPQEQRARMNELNIRYVWLTGLAPDFPTWAKALPQGQFLQADPTERLRRDAEVRREHQLMNAQPRQSAD